MKRSLCLFTVAIGLILTGCLVPSLHPLYNDNEVVTRPGIAGRWSPEDGDAIWDFELEPDSSYSLAYVDSDESDTSWFTVRLVQLDTFLFMDMYPDPSEVLTDAYKSHLIAAHTFSRIDIDSDAITISVLDADWLRKSIDSGWVKIAHEQLGPDDLVLTAGTQELRMFLLSIVDDTDAFSSVDLYRQMAGQPPK
ncbi:MAG: hypothetical protein HY851_12055 [candidate division Zixibacteria bacterium]|nr:hypothetical protein [candidate division Zixibacteria bacterium]